VHDLVVGALQEGRIDDGERLVAFGRKPGANVTPCCSAMPTSKVRWGIPCRTGRAGAGRHRGGDRDDLVVLARFLDQALGEHLSCRVRRALDLAFVQPGRGASNLPRRENFVGGIFRAVRTPLPSASRMEGIGHCLASRTFFSTGKAGGRDCARRSGRHSRSRVLVHVPPVRKPRAYFLDAERLLLQPLRICARAACDLAQTTSRCARTSAAPK
jgi:hypothetical protein